MGKKDKHEHRDHQRGAHVSVLIADSGAEARPEQRWVNGNSPNGDESYIDAPTEKMARKDYERALKPLQAELVKLQTWAKHSGLRAVVIFEGRDAAGKGGCIKAITERVSPRVFRVIALPAPTERERTPLAPPRAGKRLLGRTE